MTLTTPSTVTIDHGLDAYMMIKEETTYGVVPDDFYTDAVYLDLSGDTIQKARENLFSSAVRGAGQRADRAVSGAAGISIGGDFLTDVSYGGLELLVYGALGGWGYYRPDITNYPTIYSHAFYPADALPSFTMEIGKGTQVGAGYRYSGILVNSLTLGVSADGFLTGTFGLIGKNAWAIDPTAVPSMLYEPLVNSTQLTLLRFLDVVVPLRDVSAVVGYAVSVDNKLSNDRRFLGSAYIKEPQRTEKRKVTGRLVLETGDEVVNAFNSFNIGTRHDIFLQFVGDALNVAYDRNFTIRTFRTEFRGGMPSLTSPGRQHSDTPFDAYSDTISPLPSFSFDGEIMVGMQNNRTPTGAAAVEIGGFDGDFAA